MTPARNRKTRRASRRGVIGWRRWLVVGVGSLLVLWLALTIVFRPSHDRTWEFGQERLPRLVATSDGPVIEQYRNFLWTGETAALPRYETRPIDLSAIETVDVFISHFDEFEGLAHIFLSFGFRDADPVVVSLESRREQGEKYSPTLGLLRQYEIIYVVGSEADIVGLRTDIRKERVYLYRTIATPEQARALFERVMADVNAVAARPRMYNTLAHNCTNELTRRVEEISSVRFPFTWKTLLPGYFDEVLYELDLLSGAGEFSAVKRGSLVDNDAAHPAEPDYSDRIRSRAR